MKKVRLVSFLLGCMLLLASFTNSHSTKELSEEEKIEHQKLVETSRLLNMPLKNPYYKVDVLKQEQADPYLGEEVIVDEWGNIHILFSADGTRLTTQESLDFYNNTMKSDGVKEIKREDGHNNTRGMVIPIELLNEPIRIGEWANHLIAQSLLLLNMVDLLLLPIQYQLPPLILGQGVFRLQSRLKFLLM